MNLLILKNMVRKMTVSKLGNQLVTRNILNSGWIFPFVINL